MVPSTDKLVVWRKRLISDSSTKKRIPIPHNENMTKTRTEEQTSGLSLYKMVRLAPLAPDESSHQSSTVLLSHQLLKSSTMNSCLFFTVLLCLSSVKADMGNDGQWIDDVSGNPVVMGMVAGPPGPHHTSDGQWIDDVSGNPVVMGMVDGHGPMMMEPVSAPLPLAPMHPSSEGQWIDDVSGNPVVMGMVAGPTAPHRSADGQWIDDVSGNPVVMGMADGHGPMMMAPAPPMHHAPMVHAAPMVHSADGQWIDDVSGNPVVMGMADGHGSMMMALAPPAHHAPMVHAAPMVHSADGQWVDDVSGNPVVMGMADGHGSMMMEQAPAVHHAAMVHAAPVVHAAPMQHSADGQWVDDVSGNTVAMGMDARTHDSGWTGNSNILVKKLNRITFSFVCRLAEMEAMASNPAPNHHRRRRHIFFPVA